MQPTTASEKPSSTFVPVDVAVGHHPARAELALVRTPALANHEHTRRACVPMLVGPRAARVALPYFDRTDQVPLPVADQNSPA